MTKAKLYSSTIMKSTIYLLFVAITIGCATAARILNEVDPQFPIIDNAPEAPEIDDPKVDGPTTTLPSGQLPIIATPAPISDIGPLPDPTIPLVAPIATPTIPLPNAPTTSTTSTAAKSQQPPLSFFMHDILGGFHPSGRVVTGLIANSQDNGLPFSKTNSQVFPINGGVPLNNINNLVNNNNNVPFLAGLNGSPSSTVVQNTGNNNVVDDNNNNNNNNLPFVSAGQLPSGITLQQLMFGTITVVDNELTQGHELGTSVLGKGQGFYLSSSLDGTSHTLALTTLFHDGDHGHVDDTISFFGVHRTGSPESHIAVIGGTGKYEHAKGYASIETIHVGDQHTTDGVETVTHFTVYLN